MAAVRTSSATAELDAVLHRHGALRAILAREAQTAGSAPDAERNIQVGLVGRGLRRREAKQLVDEFFFEADVQLQRQAIIELCASFERVFRVRLGTALGEARKFLKSPTAAMTFKIGGAKLLRDQDSFESLDSIFALFEHPDSPRGKQLRALRNARNGIAHGDSAGTLPAIGVEDAHALLTELLSKAF